MKIVRCLISDPIESHHSTVYDSAIGTQNVIKYSYTTFAFEGIWKNRDRCNDSLVCCSTLQNRILLLSLRQTGIYVRVHFLIIDSDDNQNKITFLLNNWFSIRCKTFVLRQITGVDDTQSNPKLSLITRK